MAYFGSHDHPGQDEAHESRSKVYWDEEGWAVCSQCGQYTEGNVLDDTDSEGELDDSQMTEQELKAYYGDLGSTTIPELR